MNPLLENFIGESRELIEAVSKDLLNLESNLGEPEVINSLFRNIHTLKGASGVIEGILPFTQLAHVMEDLLQKVRDGEQTINANDIDVLLECLDTLVVWVDSLEETEELPAEAEEASKDLQSQVKAIFHDEHKEVLEEEEAQSEHVYYKEVDWLAGLPSSDIDSITTHGSLTAIDYTPDSQCFFSGDDPLLWMQSIEEVVWSTVSLNVDTDPFDPFISQLNFKVLTSDDPKGLAQKLLPIESQISIFEVTFNEQQEQSGTEGAKSSELDAKDANPTVSLLKRLIDAQLDMLALAPQDKETLNGKVKSAAVVFNAIVRHLEGKLTRDMPNAPSSLDDLTVAFKNLMKQITKNANQIVPKAAAEPAKTQNDDNIKKQLENVNKRQIKTLKVDQEKVDLLMDLVGELIVAKNSMQFLARRAETEFGVRKLAQDIKSEQTVISRLSEDLQSVVMDIRMVPLSMAFQRYPRLIRDISRKLGKQVDLIIQGDDTEADKNIVEDLAEPLIHVIRNSLDHGIEMPDDRVAAGKPAVGKITLSAQSKDDSIIISVADDGKGIDAEFIKNKAVDKGILSASDASSLSKEDSLALIFEAGFSTAEQISDLSGRGVGMDSVRSAVERNGGSIKLDSEVGEGTNIQLILPLSMTVSRVMMFDVGGQTYGLPVEEVTETIKIDATKDLKKIKRVDSLVIRGQTIPVLFMSELLGVESQLSDQTNVPILVLKIGNDQLALAVDKLLEGHDVIIKPLEGALANYPIYRGAAILGDGSVLLIINVEEVVNNAYSI